MRARQVSEAAETVDYWMGLVDPVADGQRIEYLHEPVRRQGGRNHQELRAAIQIGYNLNYPGWADRKINKGTMTKGLGVADVRTMDALRARIYGSYLFVERVRFASGHCFGKHLGRYVQAVIEGTVRDTNADIVANQADQVADGLEAVACLVDAPTVDAVRAIRIDPVLDWSGYVTVRRNIMEDRGVDVSKPVRMLVQMSGAYRRHIVALRAHLGT